MHKRSVSTSQINTGDTFFDLIAAVMRRAIDDAQKGSRHAEKWLDEFYDDWRRWL